MAQFCPESLVDWKKNMRQFISTVFTHIPATFSPYKLAKADFHTGSTSDDAFLRDENSRLFKWLALTKLDPHAEIRELRQMTLYRPDTYTLLHQFATILIYLFHFDRRIYTNSKYGHAPIERLLHLFIAEPERFSPNGRPLLPPIINSAGQTAQSCPNKPQDARENAVVTHLQMDMRHVEIIDPTTAILPNTSTLTSQKIQIAGQASVASLHVVDQTCRSELENQIFFNQGTVQRDQEISPLSSPFKKARLD
jgi:hypothetical protein